MTEKSFAKDFIQFVKESPTAFHAVETMVAGLEKAGFERLDEEQLWTLEQGKGYFVTRNDSALVAFIMGEQGGGFRIVGTHSDSPTFKIKSNPEILTENYYVSLNTEQYGGGIMSTWLDRPLSVAGRIMVRTDDPMNPKSVLVNVKKDLLVIPNVAIHMQRDMNKGFSFNPQLDTIPLLASGKKYAGNHQGLLLNEVAKSAGVKTEEVLSMELFLYDRTDGVLVGLDEEYINASRIDNLGMTHVGYHALLDAYQSRKKGDLPEYTAMLCVTDNEEVGSTTKQGAHSPFLKNLLRRISVSNVVGGSISQASPEERYQVALSKSFIISADEAHAVHPNHAEYHDPTNRPLMGEGIAIKTSAAQRYVTDADSMAVFAELCRGAGQPYQTFHNRSDKVGGSTIGPITTIQLDIRGLDVGNPILGMHSMRETAHAGDHFSAYKVMLHYYNLC